MSNEEVFHDLKFAKSLAEQGAEAPLVGGRFGLLWGVLLCITFMTHWAVVTGRIPLPLQWLGIVWLSFALIGGGMTFVLDRSIQDKPGLSSTGNRIDSVIWMFFGAMMFTCFLGIVVRQVIGDGGYILFDLMVAIGFAGQGMAFGVTSRVSGQSWLIVPALAAFAMAVVSFYFYATPALYLVAALGSLITIVLPSAIQISREPADVG